MLAIRSKYALVGEELELVEEVELVWEGGRLVDWYPTTKKVSDLLVMPALVNAHTHLADCYFPDAWLRESLSEIVDPSKGLKRKALEEADIKEAIKMGMEALRSTGSFAAADFREGGAKGLKEALEAREEGYLPFGRVEKEEDLEEVLRLAHGLGLPEPDFPTPDLARRAAEAFKAAGKPVGLHLAEVRKEPVQKALDLGADFVVHGCFLEYEDLEELKRNGVALVVCPRSNRWFGLKPKVKEAIEVGVKLLLGSDNCTFNKPDLWRDLEASAFELRSEGAFDDEAARELLKAVTTNAEKPLGLPWKTALVEGSRWPALLMDSKLLALDRSKNKYATIVKRGGPEALVGVVGKAKLNRPWSSAGWR